MYPIILIVLFTFTISFSSNDYEAEAARSMNKGKNAMNARNYELAEKEFLKALDIRKNSLGIWDPW